ncbi:MAG: PLP-dependent transferase, partial [Myxococcota bacterium]
ALVEGLARAIVAKEVPLDLQQVELLGLDMGLLKAGDHVVCGRVVYGGTTRLLRELLGPLGVRTTFVDPRDPAAIRAAIEPRTRLVLVESPANPTLELVDLAAAAEASGRVPLVVDNTLLTATEQRPLELGATVSLYSTTKFVEGHNATVGGAVLTRDAALAERIAWVRNATGSIGSPLDAFLTLQGLKTLPLRMARHGASALAVATFLERHPAVERVWYPFLPSFPQHALARRQQRSGGGVLSFELRGGVPAAIAAMDALQVCTRAESLGAVQTLVTHPATMTHADVPRDERLAAGLSDGLVRLSVGLEDPEDLIADLDRALTGGAR